jgi:molecular chaperone GrpE
MRIPITINGREDPRTADRRYSLRGFPPVSEEYGDRRGRAARGRPRVSMRDPSNLAVDHDTFEETEGTRFVDGSEEAIRENQVPVQKKDPAGTEEPHEDWKERYIRLRADFDNYKRHAEAQREHLAGIGKEKVLEDVFPLVEHMERAIKAVKGAGDQTGILEGIRMVYQEMLRVLEKNGVERIDSVGAPFDPEIHEAVAVTEHPDFPEDTVVEEVRAGFMKNGKLLRPASVVVAQ